LTWGNVFIMNNFFHIKKQIIMTFDFGICTLFGLRDWTFSLDTLVVLLFILQDPSIISRHFFLKRLEGMSIIISSLMMRFFLVAIWYRWISFIAALCIFNFLLSSEQSVDNFLTS
jgi:hypothetical protein